MKLILSDKDKMYIYAQISESANDSGKPILRSEENLMRVTILVTEQAIIEILEKEIDKEIRLMKKRMINNTKANIVAYGILKIEKLKQSLYLKT